MSWSIVFDPDFERELAQLPRTVLNQFEFRTNLLRQQGPALGRPYADTLVGSRHTNMKELRLSAEGGGWRIAFAFDPNRQAILLLAGNKQGIERRFYRRFIRTADTRFDRHLFGLESQL